MDNKPKGIGRIAPVCLALAALIAWQGQAFAVITPLDSGSFAHLYEGNVYPTTGGVFTEFQTGSATASTDGNVLTIVSPGASDNLAWYPASWAGESNPAIGLTVEVRLKAYATTAVDGNFRLFGGDGSAANNIAVQVGPSFVRGGTIAGPTVISTADNTDGFHVFRLAKDGGSGVYQIWRDGVQIGTDIAGAVYSFDMMEWTDGSGDIYGQVDVDYFRWDLTGGFSPVVPEPSSLALLGLGALALWVRRGKKLE
ncbi:MAG: PEP-CTERM sorting domain-containing protein [Acidobacteria bacterium]|nr:PEP-CTERM sorting domain-containing protein [Acidobacteriota bacterium]